MKLEENISENLESPQLGCFLDKEHISKFC